MKEYKMKKDSDIKDYTFGQYLREIRKTKDKQVSWSRVTQII